MTPGLDNIPNRTESQAREDIARKDRASWIPATHGSGDFGIIAKDGREVCRSHKHEDRDAILSMARAHDALRRCLSDFLEGITDMRTRKVIDEENDDQWLDHITERAKAVCEARG